MDGVLIDGRTGKLFLCNKHKGHALGIILRVRTGDHFVDRLLLFRHAFVFSHEVSAEIGKVEMRHPVATVGYVEGTMHDIECDVCGKARTWWMGEAALERFLESRKKKPEFRVVNLEKEHA